MGKQEFLSSKKGTGSSEQIPTKHASDSKSLAKSGFKKNQTDSAGRPIKKSTSRITIDDD